eukprot:404662-Prymnesium_polylepis.1
MTLIQTPLAWHCGHRAHTTSNMPLSHDGPRVPPLSHSPRGCGRRGAARVHGCAWMRSLAASPSAASPSTSVSKLLARLAYVGTTSKVPVYSSAPLDPCWQRGRAGVRRARERQRPGAAFRPSCRAPCRAHAPC